MDWLGLGLALAWFTAGVPTRIQILGPYRAWAQAHNMGPHMGPVHVRLGPREFGGIV